MATSGTYTFNPSLGELTLYAFDLAGVRPTAILQEHMQSARMASNMMLARWANQGVNLWAVDLIETTLVEGQSTYNVDANTVMILDAYMRIDDGSTDPIDRIILPVSRSEYANYPNKDQQGFTTVFWFDRLIAPTITLWPVPDGSSAQYLRYYRVRRIQDSEFSNGQNVEIPYLWLEAFATGLAERLALVWHPEKFPMLKAEAAESYRIAADQNVENAQFYIAPSLGNYWRP